MFLGGHVVLKFEQIVSQFRYNIVNYEIKATAGITCFADKTC